MENALEGAKISTKGWRFVRREKNKRILHTSKQTRLEWISEMKIGNKVFCMVKFHGGKPRKLIVSVLITKPLDKVEQFARTLVVNPLFVSQSTITRIASQLGEV